MSAGLFAIVLFFGVIVSVSAAGLWLTFAEERNVRFSFRQEQKVLPSADPDSALALVPKEVRALIEESRLFRSRLEGVVFTLNRNVFDDESAFMELSRINRDLELFMSAASSLGGGARRRGKAGSVQDPIRILKGIMDHGDWGFDREGQHQDSLRARVESALDTLLDLEKALLEHSDPYRAG